MRVFLNELALEESWQNTSTLLELITSILRMRQRERILQSTLYCSHGFLDLIPPNRGSLRQAIQQMPRDTKQQFFRWTSKKPFIEDDQLELEDDIFYFEEREVTDLGLGEAARHKLNDLKRGDV